MSELMLEATPRTPRGKGGARQLRREGQVPAVLYGVKEPLAVQVSARQADRLMHRLHGSSQLVTLRLPKGDGGDRQVLVKEIQTTAVGGHLVHIDFNEIAADTKVRVNVEVVTVGTPPGVVMGGTQQMVMHEVPVECLPQDLPDSIEIDVSGLEIGDALHIGELTFPEGVRPLAEPDAAVIVISGRMREEVEAVVALEGEAAEGIAEAAAEGEEGAPAAAEEGAE